MPVPTDTLSLDLLDPAPRPIVGRQLDPHRIPGDQPGIMGAEPVRHVRQDLRPVLQLDPEQAVRKGLEHPAPHEARLLGHEQILYLTGAENCGCGPFAGRCAVSDTVTALSPGLRGRCGPPRP